MKDDEKPVKSKVKTAPNGGAASTISTAGAKHKPAQAKPKAKAKPKIEEEAEAAKVPAILLEGDESAAPPLSGPGSRYRLSRSTAEEAPIHELAEEGGLPEAYGTKRLLLAARDPHWLYAHWDLTRNQQNRYNALSSDRHLILRIFKDQPEGAPASEIHVHPESRNWFVHVHDAGAKYFGVLGYYQRSGKWVSISSSEGTLTPPDTISEDTTFMFETLPADMRFDHLIRLIKTVVKENVPLVEAIQQLRASGYTGLPTPQAMSRGRWTSEQERALAEIISMDSVRRVWVGSLEITELIRRQLRHDLSSLSVSAWSQPSSWSGAVSSFSSPFGGVPRGKKSFWFNINAELIIYGATEPDAEVTIGGRKIALRKDGSFSYRFSLPDGHYELPAVAVSADGTDRRTAALKFLRSTQYQGEVGRHPQDPSLKPPRAENVA